MTKEERFEESVSKIEKVLKEANIDMTLDEFVKVYASNKGIKANPINVWRNMEKYQLMLPGNLKHLYTILEESNFLKNLGDSFKHPTSDAVKRAVAKYDKNNTKVISLKLNLNTDKDILDKLDKVENKQGYLKELIRKDI